VPVGGHPLAVGTGTGRAVIRANVGGRLVCAPIPANVLEVWPLVGLFLWMTKPPTGAGVGWSSVGLFLWSVPVGWFCPCFGLDFAPNFGAVFRVGR